MILNAIITHLICPIGLHKAWKIIQTDHQVTHTPWKLTGTYSGCHITQQIHHVSLDYQGPWPNQVASPKQHHQDNTKQTHVPKNVIPPCLALFTPRSHINKNAVMDQWCKPEGRITTVVTYQWVQLVHS